VQTNGIFGWRLYSDSSSPQPQPGGTFEGTGYDEFKTNPPTISNCAAPYAMLADLTGTHSTGSTTIGLPNAYVETLSGFIGDIAQTNGVRVDSIKISTTTSTFLSQTHGTPGSPLTVGAMEFESFPGHCTNWTPTYLARNVYVTNDALLVASPAALKARCFITGLTGAWSSTRSNGNQQPSAEIHRNAAGDYRMHVFPTDAGLPADRVGAYASCIQL
jgi:hypothetical protein